MTRQAMRPAPPAAIGRTASLSNLLARVAWDDNRQVINHEARNRNRPTRNPCLQLREQRSDPGGRRSVRRRREQPHKRSRLSAGNRSSPGSMSITSAHSLSGQRDGESLNEIAASRAYGNLNNQRPRQKIGDLPDVLVLPSTRPHRSVIWSAAVTADRG